MAVYNLGSSTDQTAGGLKRTAGKWLGLPTLVARAKPGDRININAEDEYVFGSQAVNGFQIVGTASPQKIILVGGQIDFKGNSVLANCTVKCNRLATGPLAFSTTQPASNLEVHNVIVEAPSRLRPAHPDVYVGQGTALWAYGSSLGKVVVDGGRLHMSPSSVASNISTVNGGVVFQVPEYGQATQQQGHAAGQPPQPTQQPAHQAPAEQASQRPRRLHEMSNEELTSNDAMHEAPSETTSNSSWAGLFDSYKQAASSLFGKQTSPQDQRRSEPRNDYIPQPSKPIGTIGHPGPQIFTGRALTWHAADGDNWESAIESQLQDGDTIFLEEGDYWITGRHLPNLKIRGTESPEKTRLTVIENPIAAGPGRSLEISNLTVRGIAGTSGLGSYQGRSLNLYNVVIDHALGFSEEPSYGLTLIAGTTTMKNCEVRFDKYQNAGRLIVQSGAVLHATNSKLGVLHCMRGAVELHECAADAVRVAEEGAVSSASPVWLTEVNLVDDADISTETGGRFTAEHVIATAQSTKMLATDDSTISIGTFIAPEGGEVSIETDDDANVNVGGHPGQIRRSGGTQSLSTKSSNRTIDEVLAELDSMIGQDEVKQQVRSLIALTNLNKTRRDRGLTAGDSPITQHFIFAGPPGTGKTTIARIIGDVFRALGALKSGHVVEVDRSKLVAEGYGGVERQTSERLDEAMDGVLLIDEAYSLQSDGIMGGDAAGTQVIEILLKRMEDDRDRLVVVATGYPDDMEKFLDSNPGLRNRFSNHINFSHYSAEELVQIVLSMVNANGSLISRDAVQALHAKMVDIDTRGLNRSRTFGNGRFARNLVAKAEQAQALRLSRVPNPTDADLMTLSREDMDAALSQEMQKLRD